MINAQREQSYLPNMWGTQNSYVDTCDIIEEPQQIQESTPSALTEKPDSSTSIISHVFFTKKIDNDRTEQSLTQLEQIPLEKFVKPFVVAQNSNNALVRMKDGSLLILENTNAKQIHASLLSRAYTAMDLTPPSPDNTLTLYIGPDHAFLGLDCTSCADGNPYHQAFGLYSSTTPGMGVIVDEKYEGLLYPINPDFLAAFRITDEQALAIMNKKKAEELNPKYNLLTDNCVDFTFKFSHIIGEPYFIDFTPKIQLNLNPNELLNSAAHQFAILKYRVGVNQDNFNVGASTTSLVISYVAIKTFTQLSKLVKKTETPPKSSLIIKMQTAEVIQAVCVLTAKVIIGPQYPQAMQIIRLAAIAIPATIVAKEIQSQEPLDKNKKPSLWNKRISLFLGLAITEVALDIAVKSTEIMVGEQFCPQTAQAIKVIRAIGGVLLAYNILRNLYYDITEITQAPCLDGVDLS